MKGNLKKLHVQRKTWKPHGRLLHVGVFILWMIMKKLIIKHTNNVLHILLSKSGNWNKSKNLSIERIDFLLQNQQNNIFQKTCGCRSLFYCTQI
jgi:hypothetical protein